MSVLKAGQVTQVSEHAPAKINLSLHITGQRDDGYHLLDSLVVFTKAGDTVAAQFATEDSLAITGRFSTTLQVESDNLVLRARDMVRRLVPDLPAVALTLEKSLPIASGIGGGSSDAAATIRALMKLAHLHIDPDTIYSTALTLGADVPMCLAAQPLHVRGVGEILKPVETLPLLNIVLVNPGVGVSTPDVFKRLASRHNAPQPALPDGLDFEGFSMWLSQRRNDMQTAAIEIAPEIGDALDALRLAGATVFRMSGSGATCFGLFKTAAQAKLASQIIASAHPSWYVEATATLEG